MSEKHLAVKPWSDLVAKFKLKDLGFQKALIAYHAIDGDKEPARALEALGEIFELALKLKKAHASKAELVEYLQEVHKELKKQTQFLETNLKAAETAPAKVAGKPSAEDESEKEAEIEALEFKKDLKKQLTNALAQVKLRAPGDPDQDKEPKPQLQFMACLAGKHCAFIVARKVGGPTKKLLSEILGGVPGGKFLVGECIFEKNAHTFVLEEVPSGLAKKLATALFNETTVKFKIRVRSLDGAVVLDSDSDIDPEDGESTGPSLGKAMDKKIEFEENQFKLRQLKARIEELRKKPFPALMDRLKTQTLEKAQSLGGASKFTEANQLLDLLAGKADPSPGPTSTPDEWEALLEKRDVSGLEAKLGLEPLFQSRIGGDLKILRNLIAKHLAKNEISEARALLKELKIKAEFIRKREKQIVSRRKKLDEYASLLIPKGDAASLLADKSFKGNRQFTEVANSLKLYESGKDDKAFATLEKSIANYLTYFDKLSAKEQAKPENAKAKREVIRINNKLDLIRTQKELTAKPDWDRQDEARAAENYVRMMLEIAAPPRNLKENSLANEMVMKVGNINDKPKLVVKPVSNEIPVEGFTQGGGASREMLACVMADKLQEMLGIELNAPVTKVVSIDGEKIGLDSGKPVTVSAQAWVTNSTNLGDIIYKDAPQDAQKQGLIDAAFARIDKEEVQNKAVFDLLSMHCDRHGSNFMVGDKENKEFAGKLIPIDHGNILPTKQGLAARGQLMGPPYAILPRTPAAKEKLSPEQVERIQRINADELIGTLKTAQMEMHKTHPEADRGDLDEGMQNVRRSIEFMKFAAAELTLEQIYIACSRCVADIFFTDEKAMKAGFRRAVQMATTFNESMNALTAIANDKNGLIDYPKLLKEAQTLGWFQRMPRIKDFEKWVQNNPQRFLKILQDKIPYTPLKEGVKPGKVVAKCPEFFLGEPVDPRLWERYQALGGDEAFARAGGGDQNLKYRNEYLESLGGVQEVPIA